MLSDGFGVGGEDIASVVLGVNGLSLSQFL